MTEETNKTLGTRDVIGFIAEEIQNYTSGKKFDCNIAIITNDHGQARYLKKELTKTIGVLVGVDIAPLPDILLQKCGGSNIASTLSQKVAILKALTDTIPDGGLSEPWATIGKEHPIDLAFSILSLYDMCKDNNKEITSIFPELEILIEKYLSEIKRLGVVESNQAIDEFDTIQYDLIFTDRLGHLSPRKEVLLDRIRSGVEKIFDIKPKLDDVLAKTLLRGVRPDSVKVQDNIIFGKFPKASDEANQSAKLAKRLLSQSEPTRIAISVPEKMVETVVEELFDANIPQTYQFNHPLNGTVAYDAFRIVLSLSTESKEPNSILSLQKNSLISIKDNDGKKIFSPLGFHRLQALITKWDIKSPSDWDNVIISEKARKGYAPDEDNDEYIKKLDGLSAYFTSLKDAIKPLSNRNTISTHAQVILDNLKGLRVLDQIQTSNALKNQKDSVKINSRVYFNIESVLLEMVYLGTDIEITKEHFSELLIKELKSHKRKVDSEIIDGISVQTYQETQYCDFDHILLLGATQEVLPESAIKLPLIDGEQFRSLFEDESKQRDIAAKINLLMILEGTESFHISHNLESGDAFSPVIEQLMTITKKGYEWESEDKIIGSKNAKAIFSHLEDEIKNELIEDIRHIETKGSAVHQKELGEGAFTGIVSGEPLDLIRKKFGPDQVWSATRFEQYIRCPFVFLGKHVYRIKEPEDTQWDVNAMEKGSVIHNILYDHGTKIITGDIDPFADKESCYENMNELAYHHVDQLGLKPLPREKLLQALIGTENNGLLHSFVDWEIEDRSTPLLLEQSFHLPGASVSDPVSIAVPPTFDETEDGFKIHPMLFRGKIDRIDKVGDYWHIVDYKSGSVNRLGSKPKYQPTQLAVYHEAVENLFKPDGKVGAFYYLSLKKDPFQVEGLPDFKTAVNGKEVGGAIAAYVNEQLSIKTGAKKQIKDLYNLLRCPDPITEAAEYLKPKSGPDTDEIKNTIQRFIEKEGCRDITDFVVKKCKEVVFNDMYDRFKSLLEGDFSGQSNFFCSDCYLHAVCSVGGDSE